jgi:formylglycine-generating enzyme required for sulfatase activity
VCSSDLAAQDWPGALALLAPRAETGEEAALRLLAGLVETAAAPREQRQAAAELLGERDPRLLDPQRGDSALGSYWCQIEAGPFWFGDDRREELRQVTLPYAYRIGRYPVTNLEYGRFIAAGGYRERRWWTDAGWDWKGDRRQPRYWDNARFNAPLQPVLGVSWWEAAAYCAWLTAGAQAAGRLAAGEEIRLPTALEWERAARGTERRRYPWGDAPPDAERANYQETGLGQPSLVGLFPAGASASGALDMAGNVLEWLATPDRDPAQVSAAKNFTRFDFVLLTRSYFRTESEHLCCGARDRVVPDHWVNYRGFRVCRSLRAQ